MLEKDIEKDFCNKVRKRGAVPVKNTPMSFNGMPDRNVYMSGGRLVMVEFKQRGKVPTKLQDIMIEQMRVLGFTVWVIDRPEQTEAFIKRYL